MICSDSIEVALENTSEIARELETLQACQAVEESVGGSDMAFDMRVPDSLDFSV